MYKTGDLGMLLADGKLMHIGRRDSQVKIRGHRIELSEIELTLRAPPSVQAAVIEARPRDDGEQALVAFVEPVGGIAPTLSDLRDGLSRTLPDDMIPSAFVWLDKLPSLPNGKVDRHALPSALPLRPSLDAPLVLPRTSNEAQLASVWAKILSLDEIGINDPFLEFGGDSLQAARILARIVDAFKIELPLTAMFDAPTVAKLGEWIDRQGGTPPRSAGTTTSDLIEGAPA